MKLLNFFNRSTRSDNLNSAPRAFSYKGGILVTEQTAMKVAAFNRGVNYLSSQLSKLPVYIKDKDNNILDNDPVYHLLNTAPNKEMNHFKFKMSLIKDAIIYGNGYAEIERDLLGRPIALWYIESNRVCPMRDPRTGRLFFRVTGGYLSSPGVDVDLDPMDIFHITNLHVDQGIVGQGAAAWAQTTLGISMGADRMAAGLFNNGGLPSGVLKHPKLLSDEAYKRLKDSWYEDNGGDKNGGVTILEEGAEFEALNMDPQVLQFLESRKFGVLEIARFLNLPPNKLFDGSQATYNNIEQANIEMITDTLGSWAVNWEAECDVKLLRNNHSGRYTDVDLDSVSRGDMKSRSDYYGKMMQTAAMSPNEIRRAEGKAPYKGGDEFYIAVNNYTPASRLDEVIDAQIKKGQQKETPGAGGEGQTDSIKAAVDKLLRS